MREVRFAEYRRYEARRVEASNAMMALPAGAGMASHLLQLTCGSKHLLPEVFPQVPHIGRFNLPSERAREILDAADVHLGAMSIPYALAIHDGFLRECLGLLVTARACTTRQAAQANGQLAAKHPLIAQSTGGAFTADSLGQLTTLRLMRNCMIHEGGRADQTLLNDLATWTPSIEAGWVKLTGNNPRQLRLGAELSFGHGEMILALAVTKVLAREANQLLQPKVPRSQWADMLIADLVDSDSHVLRASDFGRRAGGFAKFHYAPLQLSDTEPAEARNRYLGP
ncbi:MAG TPA: hypothetical protein VN327_03825 [Pseudonocardiaceae bacterium]|jgi:hypothetical protein|nr:hypothetical protein [Pseudonocardiaceae bacterium]